MHVQETQICLQYKAVKNMAQWVLGQHQSGKGHVSPRRPNALGTLPLHKPCVTSYSSFLLWKTKKNKKTPNCWIPQNLAVKCNPPHRRPLTWRRWHLPLHSALLLLRFASFLFLVYCVASRQSLHVFPWKPFCLLSIFLHYLPFALCFSICLFFLAFFISFSPCLPSLAFAALPPALPLLLLALF